MIKQTTNVKNASKTSNNSTKKTRGNDMSSDINTVVFGCCCDKMKAVKKLRRD